MLKRQCVILVLALVWTASSASPTLAQWAAMNAIRLDVNMGGFRRQVLSENSPRAANEKPEAQRRQPVVTNPASLRFTSSVPQRRQNLAAFVRSADQNELGSGAKLQAFFDAGDPVSVTQSVITPLGLRTDNLADTLSFYLLSHWMAVNGQPAWPDRATVQALRRQSERTLLQSGQFRSASNAEKQKTAEGMMISGLLTISAYASAEGDPAATAAIAARAAQNMQSMGLDLAALELTEAGFVPAR